MQRIAAPILATTSTWRSSSRIRGADRRTRSR
ncbi:hypothetical protein MUK42_01300 [Musa troglodytarum]|uniref:Uncharacterized protein n=1 Tax=Musa troglodytarum TaxID=320322 RepID=A0A9E7F846_9LILI|nr:hypothetical protein MUK42_01300 [Musa troglodytarum]